MPASPDLAADLAEPLRSLYADAELYLLELVARRLRRGITEEGWAVRKLLETNEVQREITAYIAGLDRQGQHRTAQAIRTAYQRGQQAGAADLRAAGLQAGSGALQSANWGLNVLLRETTSAIQSTHWRVLRSVDDAYREAVSAASAQVLAGTATRVDAAQMALDRLLGRGITGFVDRAGRNWDAASYTEMAVRAGTGNAAVLGHVQKLQAAGEDLVIVSTSPASCPKCAPWQGRVLSISGQSPDHPSVSAARAGGLGHPGCTHRFGLWLPGITPPSHPPADTAQRYEAKEQQRYLERGVREYKRRAALALDDQAKREANVKVRAWRGRLAAHVERHDLKRLRYREVVGRAH